MHLRSLVVAFAAAFGVAAGTVVPAHAELVRTGTPFHPLDTETGLEWNLWGWELSPQRMQHHLSPEGLMYGWRYATLDEVAELFRHAGIPDITYGTEPQLWTKANYEPVLRLLDLVGVQYPYGCYTRDCPHSEGISGTTVPPGETPPRPIEGPPGTDKQYSLAAFISACGACWTDEFVGQAAAVVGGTSYAQDAAGWAGHWLVREHAPADIAEPGTLLLLGGGMLGLAGALSRARRDRSTA